VFLGELPPRSHQTHLACPATHDQPRARQLTGPHHIGPAKVRQAPRWAGKNDGAQSVSNFTASTGCRAHRAESGARTAGAMLESREVNHIEKWSCTQDRPADSHRAPVARCRTQSQPANASSKPAPVARSARARLPFRLYDSRAQPLARRRGTTSRPSVPVPRPQALSQPARARGRTRRVERSSSPPQPSRFALRTGRWV
jgi:hypothetical protein